MKLHRRDFLAGAAGLAALAPSFGHAQTRWQMATPYADGNLHTRNIRTFIEDIQKASNGQLNVQLHSNGALLKMPEIKRGVQTGQVQLGEILLTAYANEDPLFDADALPQLVVNYAQAKRLSDLQRPFIEARFARQGLSLLYMVPWPPAGLYSQEPVTSLEQLRGQRFRTFSPMTNRFAQLIGAQPTLVQAAELAQAFATGVVQAQITSAATGVDTQSWDYAKVFTPLGFSMTKNAVFVSSRALQGLPQPQQQMIRDAAAAAERRGYELSEQAAKETEATLGQRGMRVLQPSARLLEDLTRVGRTMADEWVQRAGEDGKKLLDAYRASA
ncbi:MAG: TRAP transporter substrate-binding protein [Roseomonas sp.]|nr:TRAP transporter substrate-binding protein [Roseomonas sp.]MCA3408993.1 TRAP transporter substrate-binding protein [Roseomonas sp.]